MLTNDTKQCLAYLLAGGTLGAVLTSPTARYGYRRLWSLISGSNVSKKYETAGDRAVHDYVVSVSCRQTKELEELHKATWRVVGRRAGMMSPPDSVAIHQMVARLVDAKKIVEVGVFTGYTALGMALVLPPGGKLVACDISQEYADIGKPYWKSAGVADKIDLRIAPALETLQSLLDNGEGGTYDLGFIDADKDNYPAYYELVLSLLRPGGVVMVDNVLWGARRSAMNTGGQAIHQTNLTILNDDRVDVCMLKNSDGITLARKR